MYCQKCGKEIDDDAEICRYCGNKINDIPKKDSDTSKTGIGILLGFLSLLGLIVGLLYPADTLARKTFIKAWAITFVILTALEIIFCILIFSMMMSMAGRV